MKRNILKSAFLLVTGFGVGMLASHFPVVSAANIPGAAGLSQKQFFVSIDEIRQNFVSGDKFTGHYTRTVTLSDGTKRHIELTPMIHDGAQVVEFKDNGSHTYMGLNGTTTNGKLMVGLLDLDAVDQQPKAEGSSAVVR